MRDLLDETENLNLTDNIELQDIPEIDLYMDQVIQIFESKLSNYKRNEDDKILTKTMINNYVKGKLLMPVKNKKYSKEHIILMSFIYNLKGALSISDIKKLLEQIVVDIEDGNDVNIEETYSKYLDINKINSENFKEEVRIINEEIEKQNINKNKELILASALIDKANMYRKLAEKIIDENN
ncbi:DUF1836 domain-containing protein [Clostridium mediterraneense]|uniref:DUF1836 domain-containing protein n=1 Tax=Clostridium mediterraneense TaxID=1805472 RepID=UPI0008340310|nr:DUF1836 domain-containing protein [Clostridium mediterraneense]